MSSGSVRELFLLREEMEVKHELGYRVTEQTDRIDSESDQRMDLHVFLIVLFLSSLLLGHNGVQGGKELSEEEDLELEKQLKLMSNPTFKTIKYAVNRTRPGPNKYNGAGGVLSLHNPFVTGRQYSAVRLKLENGKDSIQVGWRVDPALYRDIRT